MRERAWRRRLRRGGGGRDPRAASSRSATPGTMARMPHPADHVWRPARARRRRARDVRAHRGGGYTRAPCGRGRRPRGRFVGLRRGLQRFQDRPDDRADGETPRASRCPHREPAGGNAARCPGSTAAWSPRQASHHSGAVTSPAASQSRAALSALEAGASHSSAAVTRWSFPDQRHSSRHRNVTGASTRRRTHRASSARRHICRRSWRRPASPLAAPTSRSAE